MSQDQGAIVDTDNQGPWVLVELNCVPRMCDWLAWRQVSRGVKDQEVNSKRSRSEAEANLSEAERSKIDLESYLGKLGCRRIKVQSWIPIIKYLGSRSGNL